MPIPAAPLLHYYPCSEAEGEPLRDATPAGLDLPAFGTPRSITGRNGAGARERLGADAPSGFALASNPVGGPRFAISMWYKLVPGNDAWPWTIANAWGSYVAGPNSLRVVINSVQQQITTPTEGAWQHLAVSVDDAAGTWAAYAQGAPVLTGTFTPGLALSGPPVFKLLGRAGVTFHPLAIQDVAVFGGGLTDDDAAWLYNGGSGRTYADFRAPARAAYRVNVTIDGYITEI